MLSTAIIGGGSMGEALLAGLLRSGRQVAISWSPNGHQRAAYLAETYAVRVTGVGTPPRTPSCCWRPPRRCRVGRRRDQRRLRPGRRQRRRAGARQRRQGDHVCHESRLPAGSPVSGDAERAGAVRGRQCAGQGPVRHRRATRGGRPVVRVRGRSADCAGGPDRLGHRRLGFRPGVLLLFVEALVDAAVAIGLTQVVATELVSLY